MKTVFFYCWAIEKARQLPVFDNFCYFSSLFVDFWKFGSTYKPDCEKWNYFPVQKIKDEVERAGLAGSGGWRMSGKGRPRAIGARFSNTAAAHCAHYLFSASLKLAPNNRVIMSSASFWSNACKNAKGKPLQTLLDALYGCCGATVRRARAADCALFAAV